MQSDALPSFQSPIRVRRSIIWTHADVQRSVTRQRGNPNWGRPMLPASVLCTEFELQVRQLQLAPEAYVFSDQLRGWCERNRNRFYIPEWLLNEWDIRVNPYFSGAA